MSWRDQGPSSAPAVQLFGRQGWKFSKFSLMGPFKFAKLDESCKLPLASISPIGADAVSDWENPRAPLHHLSVWRRYNSGTTFRTAAAKDGKGF